jgi:hypothetical protein
MKVSIAGMAVQIFILFFSLIVLPIYFMSIIQYYKDVNRIQTAERNFVDYVIDNRQVSDAALSELNLSIAAVSTPVKVEIKRETRVINPGSTAGAVDVSWIAAEYDNTTIWDQGDLITVTVKQEQANIMQQISSVFLGSSYNNLNMRLTAMVR